MPAPPAPRTASKHPCPSRRSAPARPQRAFLNLGAVLTAPGCARAWTREILWEWGLADLVGTADIVVSELVTNSVNACAGLDRAVIRLVLALEQGELAILVRDEHPGAPVPAQPGADDEGGRGLLIVETLSDRCGWYPLESAKPAKVTWAVISGSGRADGELPRPQDPGGFPDAGTAGGAQPAPALPARPRRAAPPTTGMRAPRLVDLEILARVRAALERL